MVKVEAIVSWRALRKLIPFLKGCQFCLTISNDTNITSFSLATCYPGATCNEREPLARVIPNMRKEFWNVGEVVNYSCPNYHTLRGESSIKCGENGEWMEDLPQCESNLINNTIK